MRRVALGTERGDVCEGVRRRCDNYDGFLSKWFSKGLPVPFTCSRILITGSDRGKNKDVRRWP